MSKQNKNKGEGSYVYLPATMDMVCPKRHWLIRLSEDVHRYLPHSSKLIKKAKREGMSYGEYTARLILKGLDLNEPQIDMVMREVNDFKPDNHAQLYHKVPVSDS